MARRLRLVALLAAAVTTLTACELGGSNGNDGVPIKLGLISPLTGSYQPLGTEQRKGAELAVKEINAAGGVLGRRIELLVRDDRTDPEQAVAAYNALKGEGVAAVVGSSFPGSGLATIPLAERDKMPFIATGTADEQVEPVRRYAFMASPTAGAVAERLLAFFAANGMTRMALAYDTRSAFAQTGARKMREAAARHGVELVMVETFEPSASDFSPLLARVRGSGAQGLMVWAIGSPAVTVTKQFATTDLGLQLVFSHAEASPLYTEPAGAAAEDVIVASSVAAVGPQLPDSQVKQAITAMADAFSKEHGYYPPQPAFDGYCAVKLLAEAIKRAGSADGEDMQRALERLSLVTPMGTYEFSPQDHSGLAPGDISVNVVQDGQLVPTDWALEQLASTLP